MHLLGALGTLLARARGLGVRMGTLSCGVTGHSVSDREDHSRENQWSASLQSIDGHHWGNRSQGKCEAPGYKWGITGASHPGALDHGASVGHQWGISGVSEGYQWGIRGVSDGTSGVSKGQMAPVGANRRALVWDERAPAGHRGTPLGTRGTAGTPGPANHRRDSRARRGRGCRGPAPPPAPPPPPARRSDWSRCSRAPPPGHGLGPGLAGARANGGRRGSI